MKKPVVPEEEARGNQNLKGKQGLPSQESCVTQKIEEENRQKNEPMTTEKDLTEGELQGRPICLYRGRD